MIADFCGAGLWLPPGVHPDGEAVEQAFRETAEPAHIDDLLGTLAEFDERAARVVECRYFAGLSIEETATALGVARSTVTDDWRLARAWLACELGDRENERTAE